MQIQWHGLGCFSVTGKPVQGEVTVITDPFKDKFGVKPPRAMKAAMVVSSHDGDLANNTSFVEPEEGKEVFEVAHAGEYEVDGAFVIGVNAPLKDGTQHAIYRINMEGINVGFLGALDRPLKEKEIEAFGDIHVLIVPVGGDTVLDAQKANEVVAGVEPRIVIPSHYASGKLNLGWANEEAFCKELSCPRKDETKLKITKAGLPVEDMDLIVLKQS